MFCLLWIFCLCKNMNLEPQGTDKKHPPSPFVLACTHLAVMSERWWFESLLGNSSLPGARICQWSRKIDKFPGLAVCYLETPNCWKTFFVHCIIDRSFWSCTKKVYVRWRVRLSMSVVVWRRDWWNALSGSIFVPARTHLVVMSERWWFESLLGSFSWLVHRTPFLVLDWCTRCPKQFKSNCIKWWWYSLIISFLIWLSHTIIG